MITTAIKAASVHGGPIVFGAGAAMLAAALAGSTGSDGTTAAPQPAPTVTVTGSPAPARAHRSPHPSPSSTAPPAGATVVAASRPTRTTGGVAEDRTGGSSGGGTGGASGSSSTWTPRPSAGPRCVLGVSALALHECLSLGGGR